jgi:hypothetical protein
MIARVSMVTTKQDIEKKHFPRLWARTAVPSASRALCASYLVI